MQMLMPPEAKIAIDVVLLLPQTLMKLTVDVNRALVEGSGNRNVVLNSGQCIPHVSLAMGAIPRRSLPVVSAEMESIARGSLPMNLEIEHLAVVKTDTGDVVSGFDIRCTDDLMLLHEWIMAIIGQYHTGRVDEGMVQAGEDQPIHPFTTRYIEKYAENAAFMRFSPHITIGYGDATEFCSHLQFPLPFTARSIAVCHLGNFCTCREVLSVHTSG